LLPFTDQPEIVIVILFKVDTVLPDIFTIELLAIVPEGSVIVTEKIVVASSKRQGPADQDKGLVLVTGCNAPSAHVEA
jgi:hypothetical protein